MIDFGDYWQCHRCRFWDALEPGQGYCRRHAPRGVVEVSIDDDGEDETPVQAVWPVTRHDDWCGEFVKDEVACDGD